MKWKSLILAALLVCLVACDKAPDGIIKESKMEKLLIDLYKAEGYMAQHPEQFPEDSQKEVIKQSVYKKYGITQSDYDSSMVWYAKNIESYNKVYRRVIKQLTDEQSQLTARGSQQVTEADGSPASTRHKTYASTGDTANLWTGTNRYMLTPLVGQGFLKFDRTPDPAYRPGDRYQLSLKMLTFSNSFGIFFAVDYSDGSTSFVYRNTSPMGWLSLDLQSDSSRKVNRIYGYLRYDVSRNTVAFLDSIQVLRTHLNASNYGIITTQKFLSRDNNAPSPGKSRPLARRPRQGMGGPRESVKSFSPKPGLNKGGHLSAR